MGGLIFPFALLVGYAFKLGYFFRAEDVDPFLNMLMVALGHGQGPDMCLSRLKDSQRLFLSLAILLRRACRLLFSSGNTSAPSTETRMMLQPTSPMGLRRSSKNKAAARAAKEANVAKKATAKVAKGAKAACARAWAKAKAPPFLATWRMEGKARAADHLLTSASPMAWAARVAHQWEVEGHWERVAAQLRWEWVVAQLWCH